MAEKIDGRYVFVKPATMAHPTLFEAKKFKNAAGKESGDAKFSAEWVLDPDSPDVAGMKAKIKAVINARWPGRSPSGLALPIKLGDKEAERRSEKRARDGKEVGTRYDYLKGKIVIKTSTKYPVRLAVLANGSVVELEDDAMRETHRNKFYSGVLALPQINFQPYDGIDPKPDGVTAYLDMVLTLNKGMRIQSSVSASDVFKGYVGQMTDEDPTGGEELDDEIPF